MTINTQTITATGETTPFEYAGGQGVITVAGELNGKLVLMVSLDSTNYSPAGEFKEVKAVKFTLPACHVKWVHESDDGSTPDLEVSTETV